MLTITCCFPDGVPMAARHFFACFCQGRAWLPLWGSWHGAAMTERANLCRSCHAATDLPSPSLGQWPKSTSPKGRGKGGHGASCLFLSGKNSFTNHLFEVCGPGFCRVSVSDVKQSFFTILILSIDCLFCRIPLLCWLIDAQDRKKRQRARADTWISGFIVITITIF